MDFAKITDNISIIIEPNGLMYTFVDKRNNAQFSMEYNEMLALQDIMKTNILFI